MKGGFSTLTTVVFPSLAFYCTFPLWNAVIHLMREISVYLLLCIVTPTIENPTLFHPHSLGLISTLGFIFLVMPEGNGILETGLYINNHFTKCVISLWSPFPQDGVMTHSLDVFKGGLDRFMEETSITGNNP